MNFGETNKLLFAKASQTSFKPTGLNSTNLTRMPTRKSREKLAFSLDSICNCKMGHCSKRKKEIEKVSVIGKRKQESL